MALRYCLRARVARVRRLSVVRAFASRRVGQSMVTLNAGLRRRRELELTRGFGWPAGLNAACRKGFRECYCTRSIDLLGAGLWGKQSMR
jgi:hypothetical protein